ncbi:sensor histidine kinase [Methanobacterium sp. BAmetb5]|uniref:sensor histidine kinase n=1 Tax=Methanobacterium sp. BAmetb5 TaxID=2025351 RepID=UPI000E905DB4|nr:response regulator [Methanobacterium sp. BAmetb5]AXV40487.1 MAG: hypothetical protein CIT02_09280 [Methanobacterium sp. BAmetb5]
MGSNIRILILEDVPLDLELMEAELKRNNIDFISRCVEEEVEYRKEIEEFKPDIILADHSLPHFDGISAMYIARELVPEIPFIFVSGQMGEEFAVEMLKEGATDYVLKHNLSKLSHAVKRALKEAEEHRNKKEAEKALIESERRLHDLNIYLETIINASPFAIIDLYLDGRVKSLWNPAAENIFGWKKTEVMGKPLPFLDDNRQPDYEEIIENVISGEFKSDMELECAKNDGTLIYTMMATAPLLNVDNNIQGVMATFADISGLVLAEKQIKASLEEKEVLLREIHHRVKNNLQIISSLMSLQSEYTQEPETLKMFQESKNRIRSMALIHEKLYQSKDMAHIDFGEYLKSLTKMLSSFHREKKDDVNVCLNCEDIFLEIDTAISLGLIVNELVSNCFKHAFPGSRKGNIEINLLMIGGKCKLEVVDDGVGLSGDFDLNHTKSLGLQIVQTLTMQLKGILEIDKENQTLFRVLFNAN